VTADYAAGAKWYQEAASYGLADSQFNLGILAENGLGRPKNLVEAYQWFALANGDKDAAKRRELVKVQLDAASLAEAEQTVKAFEAKDSIATANEVEEAADWAVVGTSPNASLVNRAQSLLNKLGYDVGPPDGVAGERTRDAVKSFERRNGLEETGEISIPLVTKLERLTS
jgi:localization factor PodJL